MSRIERMIRNMTRRLIGRNGAGPQIATRRRPPSAIPAVQQAKHRSAASAASDAQQAVDSFTAAMEQAMRGQRRA